MDQSPYIIDDLSKSFTIFEKGACMRCLIVLTIFIFSVSSKISFAQVENKREQNISSFNLRGGVYVERAGDEQLRVIQTVYVNGVLSKVIMGLYKLDFGDTYTEFVCSQNRCDARYNLGHIDVISKNSFILYYGGDPTLHDRLVQH